MKKTVKLNQKEKMITNISLVFLFILNINSWGVISNPNMGLL